MTILIISFLAGVLTVLAPCVLPLLPIILGASVEDSGDKYKPYIIIFSLSISIIIFSLLLKASTVFIGFNQAILTSISGLIIIFFGLITIFPNLWKNLSSFLKFDSSSNTALHQSSQKSGITGSVLIGLSLGPVFSSCSPTYAIILAVILPISIVFGLLNLFAYVLGLALILLLISVLGQRFTSQLRGISDPNSKFKKILGVIFLLVGLAIFTGYDKEIEKKLIEKGFLGGSLIEENFLDKLESEVEELELKKKN